MVIEFLRSFPDVVASMRPLSLESAMKLCRCFSCYAVSNDMGFGKERDDTVANALKEIFPEHNWRVILDRSGEYSEWALTADDNDKREHYVPGAIGYGRCVHCGKTAEELGVEYRDLY